MDETRFTTVIGPDGAVRPPSGVVLPQGAVEVSIRPLHAKANIESRARELATRRGYNWGALPEDVRAILVEDVRYEERGMAPPRPAPGGFKGSVLYMAPDFDAPLEDMKEYME